MAELTLAESANVERQKSIKLLKSFNNILTIVSRNSKQSPKIRGKIQQLSLKYNLKQYTHTKNEFGYFILLLKSYTICTVWILNALIITHRPIIRINIPLFCENL